MDSQKGKRGSKSVLTFKDRQKVVPVWRWIQSCHAPQLRPFQDSPLPRLSPLPAPLALAPASLRKLHASFTKPRAAPSPMEPEQLVACTPTFARAVLSAWKTLLVSSVWQFEFTFQDLSGIYALKSSSVSPHPNLELLSLTLHCTLLSLAYMLHRAFH